MGRIADSTIKGFMYQFNYARTALKYGCCDYLLKPVNMEDLQNTLNHIRLQLQKHLMLEEDFTLVGKHAEEIVEYTAHYMREHYMEDIDISSFAVVQGFTSAYLTKIFNKYKGVTPLKYLTDIRISFISVKHSASLPGRRHPLIISRIRFHRYALEIHLLVP